VDTVHECDRQTDRRTDRFTITKSAQRIVSRGKNGWTDFSRSWHCNDETGNLHVNIRYTSFLLFSTSDTSVIVRGVARNLFRRGTKQGDWGQKSLRGVQGQNPGVGLGAKPP